MDVVDWPKIRLGSGTDCGYVILDDLGPYDIYIGCGIGSDVSFDCDFVPHFCRVGLMFDATVKDIPSDAKSRHDLIWVRRNIGDPRLPGMTDLTEYLTNIKNGFLKMDINGGGAEWNWFLNITLETLLKFKQIAVEFHELYKTPVEIKRTVFEKLFNNFYLVYIHPYNSYDVLECTFVRREK